MSAIQSKEGVAPRAARHWKVYKVLADMFPDKVTCGEIAGLLRGEFQTWQVSNSLLYLRAHKFVTSHENHKPSPTGQFFPAYSIGPRKPTGPESFAARERSKYLRSDSPVKATPKPQANGHVKAVTSDVHVTIKVKVPGLPEMSLAEANALHAKLGESLNSLKRLLA